MTTYRKTWLLITVLVIVVGLSCSLLTIPVGALVAMALFAACCSAFVYWQHDLARSPAADDQLANDGGDPVVLRAGYVAALTALAFTAFLGMVMVLHGLAILIVIALTLTSPAVAARVTGRIGAANNPAAEALVPRPDLPERVTAPRGLAEPDLSDDALCFLWRASYSAVSGSPSVAQLRAACNTRAALLDEMERRHPDGFRRWMDSGARASGDPSKYIVRGRPT